MRKHELQIEKTIAKPIHEVFRALSEGRLFFNCGVNRETFKIDFKVGGKYTVEFSSYDFSNHGEFLEIIRDQKIAFTWCQDPSTHPIPDTVVTIHLKAQNQHTHLTLTHQGFTDQEGADNHQGGWTNGINDLASEIVDGKLKFIRLFKMPVKKLYGICENPASFFGLLGDLSKGSVDFKVGGLFKLHGEKGEISGKFTEITPEQKIAFSWHSMNGGDPHAESKVSLSFDPEEDHESWLELVHEGLMTEAEQKTHREAWDRLFNRIRLGKF